MGKKDLSRKSGITERVFSDIEIIAKKFHINKIVLFGSRARETYQEKSDIDLAVYGCDDFERFSSAMENEVWTLLSFDLINMENNKISEELLAEIERDGVLVYEKV